MNVSIIITVIYYIGKYVFTFNQLNELLTFNDLNFLSWTFIIYVYRKDLIFFKMVNKLFKLYILNNYVRLIITYSKHNSQIIIILIVVPCGVINNS